MAEFNPLDYGTPVEDSFDPLQYGSPVEDVEEEQEEQPAPAYADQAIETVKNIGKAYPVVETAATLASSIYGLPISGLAGIVALPFGLDASKKAIEKTQEALIYRPQTESGQQLLGATTYPLQKLEEGAESVSEPIAEAGYPGAATAVHTGIVLSPALIGARMGRSKPTAKTLAEIDTKTDVAIKRGVNKAIRPSVVKKSTSSQKTRYHEQAASAVKEIVKNKDNLNLIDDSGAVVEGLPKNLDQFSQAIEQTKRGIFEEYDSLAKATDEAGGINIDLGQTSKQLKPVINNKALQDLSPETIQYAEGRIESLQGRGNYTAVEAQEAIQLLNQTLDKFYRDPSPAMKGQALVDSTIANGLRTQLDGAITKATGKEYQAIKKKYGDLKSIESDVTKRSIVDARKNNKGLIDFSDIFTGHQVVSGMLRKDPAMMAGGAAAKGISHYYRMLNDPNRIVKNMFGHVEKLTKKSKELNVSEQPAPQAPLTSGTVSDITKQILEKYQKGDFSPRQVAAFDELRRRGKI